jgi:hypothetical protein
VISFDAGLHQAANHLAKVDLSAGRQFGNFLGNIRLFVRHCNLLQVSDFEMLTDGNVAQPWR